MRIAINIADLTRDPSAPMVAQLLLGAVTPGRITVNAEPKILDGMALVLECDEMRARSIAQVLRDGDDRRKVYRTRTYIEGSKGGWKKVGAKETLVTVEDIEVREA